MRRVEGEPIMTEDATSEALEHREHAEHAAESGNSFLLTVSVTIAILAVVAAAIGSLESIEEGAKNSAQNQAVLFQSKASDQWAYFQSKSTKKNIYELAAENGGPKADEFAAKAKRYEAENKEVQQKAQELQHQSDERIEESERHEKRHHTLTFGVTLLHVAIAISTISIITRGARWPWYGAIALGIGGVLATGVAYR